MDEFLKQVADPSWWVSVIVVGLLINLASAYIKPIIDKVSGNFLDAIKQSSEKQKLLFKRDVQRLLSNPEKATDLRLDILYFNLRAVLLIAISLIINTMFGILFPTNIFLSIVPLVSSMAHINDERYCRRVLREYEKQKELIV